MNDLATYIANHYGTCAVDPCPCLRERWDGCACPNWKPVRAETLDDLRAAQIKFVQGVPA